MTAGQAAVVAVLILALAALALVLTRGRGPYHDHLAGRVTPPAPRSASPDSPPSTPAAAPPPTTVTPSGRGAAAPPSAWSRFEHAPLPVHAALARVLRTARAGGSASDLDQAWADLIRLHLSEDQFALVLVRCAQLADGMVASDPRRHGLYRAIVSQVDEDGVERDQDDPDAAVAGLPRAQGILAAVRVVVAVANDDDLDYSHDMALAITRAILDSDHTWQSTAQRAFRTALARWAVGRTAAVTS